MRTLRDRLIGNIENELLQRTIFENYLEPDGSWNSYKVAEFIMARIEKELLKSLVDENNGYAVVQDE
jgi:hypothetical protein